MPPSSVPDEPEPFELIPLGPEGDDRAPTPAPAGPPGAAPQRPPSSAGSTPWTSPAEPPGPFRAPEGPPPWSTPGSFRPPASVDAFLPSAAPPRREAPPPAPQPAATSEATPKPRVVEPDAPPSLGAPGLLDLFELSARLPFSAGATIERLRLAPPPPAGVAIAHGLAWSGAAFAIRAGLSVGSPTSTGGSLAVSAACALALSGAGLLAGAALTHALARLSGGDGGYRRGLLAVSALGAAGAAAAALSPAPLLFAASGAYAAWLFVRLVSALYAAPVIQTAIVAGGLAALGLMARFRMRAAIERFEAARGAPAAALDPASAAAAASPPAPSSAAASGLDLLAAPAGLGLAAPTAASGDPSAMMRQSQAMLDQMEAILRDPAASSRVTPEQRAEFERLRAAAAEAMRRAERKAR